MAYENGIQLNDIDFIASKLDLSAFSRIYQEMVPSDIDILRGWKPA